MPDFHTGILFVEVAATTTTTATEYVVFLVLWFYFKHSLLFEFVWGMRQIQKLTRWQEWWSISLDISFLFYFKPGLNFERNGFVLNGCVSYA